MRRLLGDRDTPDEVATEVEVALEVLAMLRWLERRLPMLLDSGNIMIMMMTLDLKSTQHPCTNHAHSTQIMLTARWLKPHNYVQQAPAQLLHKQMTGDGEGQGMGSQEVRSSTVLDTATLSEAGQHCYGRASTQISVLSTFSYFNFYLTSRKAPLLVSVTTVSGCKTLKSTL